MRRLALFSLTLLLAMLGTAGSALAQPAVSVFPSPGTTYAEPGTQITFRGVSAALIGSVKVVGSSSGTHTGHIAADSDGNGGSFMPDKPFSPGETVTVSTGLNVVGGNSGAFQFKVAVPYGAIGPMSINMAPAGSNGVQHFHSRPDLLPAAITVNKNSAPAAPGDIFVAPQFGPAQNGPELLDPSGKLIWFYPIPTNQIATDFRAQTLHGQPVLTWFQGYTNNGSGRGQDEIFNLRYQQIGIVHAGNGLQGTDLHEFLLTDSGDAYIVAVSPVHYPGMNRPLMDQIVQEIDVKTGLVMFEWHALDHVPVSESYFKPNHKGHVYDPYHLNSVAIDHDGNLILSMRNTWGIYKINHSTGAVMWTLGTNHNQFKRGSGVQTEFQHAAEVQPDGTLVVFDDGGGPPTLRNARAIHIALNTSAMTATLVKQYSHSPGLNTNFEGNAQSLPGGDLFVGWGQQPYFSEFTASGQQDFDARFTAPTDSYRAYRFYWNAQPPTLPAIAVGRGANGKSTVWASWNGATTVSSWRVLGGSSPSSLAVIGQYAKTNFETALNVPSEAPYFAVQALDSKGHVLATSKSSGSSQSRVSLFGHSAFVPSSGFGGLQVGCWATSTCHIKATINAGRTVIASTGAEAVGAGQGGSVFFQLSGAGRSMLAHARRGQLPVTATITNSDGASNRIGLNLIRYGVSGRVPFSVHQGRQVQIYSHSAFVSPSGIGGVFVGCASSQSCHDVVTVTAGKTVIAHSGSQFVGGQDLGQVFFPLSSTGKSMLAHAHGNQLPVTITVSNGSDQASAQTAIVHFG